VPLWFNELDLQLEGYSIPDHDLMLSLMNQFPSLGEISVSPIDQEICVQIRKSHPSDPLTAHAASIQEKPGRCLLRIFKGTSTGPLAHRLRLPFMIKAFLHSAVDRCGRVAAEDKLYFLDHPLPLQLMGPKGSIATMHIFPVQPYEPGSRTPAAHPVQAVPHALTK
jgi:hypothetical protein